MIERYGVTFSDGATDADIELWMAFDIHDDKESLHTAKGFLGAFEHLQRAIELLYNRNEKLIIWNEWSELMFRAFVDNREIPIAGPAASWKTTCAACYAHAFWLADPARTKVIASS